MILMIQKLGLNGFAPLLRCISYMFGPHNVFGLAIFSGNVDEWYGCLKEDGLVDSYGGDLKIPFVTWTRLRVKFPLTLTLQGNFYGAYSITCSNHSIYVRALTQL